MAASESQQRAIRKYHEKLQRLYIWLSPEQKDLIASHTEKTGESINAFVHRAIAETIENDIKK